VSGDDAGALAELQARAGKLELAPGLGVEWLGTAGYRLTYEGSTLLIDPYVSRVSLSDLLRRRPALPDPAVIDRVLPAGDDVVGVLIGHTHFDHAVDAPALAARHDCSVYGSSSVTALMRAHGMPERAVEVDPYKIYELGPFAVTFVPSRHSKLVLGLAVPFDGELTCGHLDGLAPSAYRCGQVWGIHVEVGGTTLYHQGSADLLDDAIRHRGVDVFLAGIAGRSFTRRYWSRILGRLSPDAVVISHFDDFFRPLAAPQGFSLNVRVAAVPEEIAQVGDVLVAALPLTVRASAPPP
jgi:L-ascorbate metabolism protein UlaG (beta-lactamase superfamily)